MKYIFKLLSIILILSACDNHKKINRSVLSGGTLKINETENFVTLFPPATRDIVSSHIISQIHLGLVKYDVQDLSIKPAIAKSWKIDTSGTIYTFYLNTNAKFHDDGCFEGGIGRQIVAGDFKYTFEYLSKQNSNNKNFFGTVDRIVGAKQFYKESANNLSTLSLEGLQVINDSVLQITIEKPYELFIYNLASPACAVLAKEAIEKYGTSMTVGSGAFNLILPVTQNEPLFLARNDKFFMLDDEGFQLPYLDSVRFTFISSPKTEIRLFIENQLDLILGIGSEYINEFLDEHIDKFESNPPQYILNRSERLSGRGEYNLFKANVNNFYTNKMENFDLSIVYFKQPIANDKRNK
jgi:oligopeptide transport system substrate-binding protein